MTLHIIGTVSETGGLLVEMLFGLHLPRDMICHGRCRRELHIPAIIGARDYWCLHLIRGLRLCNPHATTRLRLAAGCMVTVLARARSTAIRITQGKARRCLASGHDIAVVVVVM